MAQTLSDLAKDIHVNVLAGRANVSDIETAIRDYVKVSIEAERVSAGDELLTHKQLTLLLKGVRMLLMRDLGFKVEKAELSKLVNDIADCVF